ncbi:hypothetical protein [Herbaspirillum sp. RV1423]|uniref:hypothetical protein n=1 Tax=Herbaspirillum sp. RV1423 TaxID=1443993 RepID=UPI0004B6B3D8|nr:hypothetical protein [Herbaspirillum sp. RV1423]
MDQKAHWANEGGLHFLRIPGEGARMKVERSAAGDYFYTCLRDGDTVGGSIAYEDTLTKAKRGAEAAITSCEWLEMIEDDEVLQATACSIVPQIRTSVVDH